ncbi:MAG: hypothetical protein HXX81_00645 [Campylobacterales bacterium]|nr:hypothetical protein [Campylobacterales bacterium]
MNKDIIAKEAIKTLVIDIAKYILNIEIKEIKFLDKELQRIEDRRADVVALIDNSYILHIEIQNDNDKKMALRMLRYYIDIKNINKKLPIKQYLIYIGKDRLKMENFIKTDKLDYSFNLINMKDIDCSNFFKIDTPDALVLAILCDFKNSNEQDIVNYIIQRLKEKVGKNDFEFRKYMLMLEELSQNRNLQEFIKKGEEMLTQINYETLPSYYLGLERGIERGIETGIEKGFLDGEQKAKFESAVIFIKEMNLNPEDVAKKLNLPLHELLKKL